MGYPPPLRRARIQVRRTSNVRCRDPEAVSSRGGAKAMGIALDQDVAAGRKPPALGFGIAAALAATAVTFFIRLLKARAPSSTSTTGQDSVFGGVLRWLCLAFCLSPPGRARVS